jgi:hypothetical protein
MCFGHAIMRPAMLDREAVIALSDYTRPVDHKKLGFIYGVLTGCADSRPPGELALRAWFVRACAAPARGGHVRPAQRLRWQHRLRPVV